MQNQNDKKLLSNINVFIDTSAIIALLNKKDENHERAKRIYYFLLSINPRIIITNFVIAETHVGLLSKASEIAKQWLTSAYEDYNVIRPNENFELKAVDEINKYSDKRFSLTDMLSFLVMQDMNIQYFFSFDKNFRQIGWFSDIKKIL